MGIGTANGVDQNYAAASPNDPDLGEQAILKRVEKYEPFTIEVGAPIYYTSNVALVDRGAISDVIITPVAGITYAPKFSRTLYGEFSLRQQFFFYGENTDFNFASFDVLAGLVYYVPRLNSLTLRANVDYNRLTGTDDFDDFFSNYALQLSAELPIRIGRAQQISLGVDANVSLYAYPEPPRRNDFSAYVGYAVNVSRSLARPYDSGGRTDASEVLALDPTYTALLDQANANETRHPRSTPPATPPSPSPTPTPTSTPTPTTTPTPTPGKFGKLSVISRRSLMSSATAPPSEPIPPSRLTARPTSAESIAVGRTTAVLPPICSGKLPRSTPGADSTSTSATRQTCLWPSSNSLGFA